MKIDYLDNDQWIIEFSKGFTLSIFYGGMWRMLKDNKIICSDKDIKAINNSPTLTQYHARKLIPETIGEGTIKSVVKSDDDLDINVQFSNGVIFQAISGSSEDSWEIYE